MGASSVVCGRLGSFIVSHAAWYEGGGCWHQQHECGQEHLGCSFVGLIGATPAETTRLPLKLRTVQREWQADTAGGAPARAGSVWQWNTHQWGDLLQALSRFANASHTETHTTL
jgi:hypothetical protein